MEIKGHEKATFSENQIIFSVLFIYVFHDFFWSLRFYGITLSLNAGNPVSSPMSLGYILRNIFIYQSIPLFLFLSLLQKHFKVKLFLKRYNTFLSTSNLLVMCFFSLLIFVYGLECNFLFFGYETRILSLIVYMFLSQYLMLFFRKENFLLILLMVTWGIFVVEELWEIPFVWFHSNMHPFVFVTSYLARWIPILVWFYLFRHLYLNLIKEKLVWVLLCFLIISTFTMLCLASTNDTVSISLSTILRATYGMLLIIFPFHFQKKNG